MIIPSTIMVSTTSLDNILDLSEPVMGNLLELTSLSTILKPWTQTFIGTQVPCIRFEDQAKADIKTMQTVTTVVQVEMMHQLICELQINCNNHMQL